MTSKPHRLSTCHRHPTVPVTGICASCLRERLAGFHSPPLPHHRRTTSSSAIAIANAATDPRRHSCEVRPRSSLLDLFDDDRSRRNPKPESESSANSGFEIGEAEHANEGSIRVCDEEDDEETKTMKEFIDLELQKSRKRDLRSFRDAFTEKFRKWKWKHKLKKKNHNSNGNGNGSVDEKLKKSMQLKETQSEIGEYGLGRRSCDTDPRLSMDAGRISVDWPRASWDGCLIGPCSCSRLSPMVSVVEDANDSVLVEESNNNVGFDELKLISNAKVSPATTELFYGAKLLTVDDKDLSLRDSVIGSASKGASDVATGVRQKGFKKLHKWGFVWNKLGLVQRREGEKMGEGECVAGDMVNKPLAVAESWKRLRRVVNVRTRESVSQKLIRSYSVSCGNPCRMDGLVNRLGVSETKGNALNGRQEFMLQRNRSVGYSPNKLDTGLLRFYLTPLKSYRRSKSGKSSIKDLHPIARSVL